MLEKPPSVVSQVTQLFGYSATSYERHIDAICLDGRDVLYLNDYDSIELWQLDQERSFKFVKSSKLKHILLSVYREGLKLNISEMSFHEK